MQLVIFDSSFLMAIVDRPTPWFEDMVEKVGRFQPVIPDCVGEELSKIAGGRGKRSRTARLAISISSGFQPIRCGSASVDDEIASAALSSGAFVATTDKALLLSLKAMKVGVVSLSRGRVALR